MANSQDTTQHDATPSQQQDQPVQTGILWPMTGFYGDIAYLDEDTFYTEIISALQTSQITHQSVNLSTLIPMGTPSERAAISASIISRIQRDPSINIAVWQHEEIDQDTTTPTYAIRQSDGTFAHESIENVVGGLVSGRLNTLETTGSVADQRAFFAAVKEFIGTVDVMSGNDVTMEGAVTFNETRDGGVVGWQSGVLATVEALEEAFENMVLENMRPVEGEEELAEAMEGMDVDYGGE